ncbi:methyl-accepting chemotaxis protein [Paenibacillus sp. TRM 82003]|nr:methyl-accepting chemotaxis protein [Paenibacillus sp. TRM 82003]
MEHKKNQLMLWLTFGTLLLTVVTHVLNRGYDVFDRLMADNGMLSGHGAGAHGDLSAALNVIFALPWLLFGAAIVLFIRNPSHRLVPMLVTFALSFGSISIVAGGGGYVEFHFSIFMVAAFLAFYENIKLVLVMTVISAAAHLLFYFWETALYFGHDTYTFPMLLLHATFLVLTNGAVIWQTASKRRMTEALEAAEAQKQEELAEALGLMRELTANLDGAFAQTAAKSDGIAVSGREMLQAFQSVTEGIQHQSESIASIEKELLDIDGLVRRTQRGSSEMRDVSVEMERTLPETLDKVERLNEGLTRMSTIMEHAATTIDALQRSSRKVNGIVEAIQDVANQTNLLALNASIEAARAGQEGKGFAVVAGEIRKLAVRSRQATEEIGEILRQIQDDTLTSAEQITHGKTISEESVVQGRAAIGELGALGGNASSLIGRIADVDGAIGRLAERTGQIASSLTRISDVTEQSAASVEELLAATTEQVSASEAMNEEMQRVRRQSFALQERFPMD